MTCRPPISYQTLCLHKAPRLHSVEVHAACQIIGVELHLMAAGRDLTVDQLCHPLPQRVKHSERYVRSMRQAVADRGRGVEGIGVVLQQGIRRCPDVTVILHRRHQPISPGLDEVYIPLSVSSDDVSPICS